MIYLNNQDFLVTLHVYICQLACLPHSEEHKKLNYSNTFGSC